MIKAEIDKTVELVRVETDGEAPQLEHELIALMAALLDTFTADDMAKMLTAAIDYNNTQATLDNPVN